MGGDFIIIAGAPGVGKTTLVDQSARHLAMWALENELPVRPVRLDFEGNRDQITKRSLCLNTFLATDRVNTASMGDINKAIYEAVRANHGNEHKNVKFGFDQVFDRVEGLREGWEVYSDYIRGIDYLRCHLVHTTPKKIDEIVRRYLERDKIFPVLFIDYLQKIPVPYELSHLSDDSRISHVVRSLEETASNHQIPIITIAALSDEALQRNGPFHLEDIWGGSLTKYDPDIGLVLNLESTKRTGYKNQAIKIRLGMEKVRHGQSREEIIFDLYGASFYIDPDGELVSAENSRLGKRDSAK